MLFMMPSVFHATRPRKTSPLKCAVFGATADFAWCCYCHQYRCWLFQLCRCGCEWIYEEKSRKLLLSFIRSHRRGETLAHVIIEKETAYLSCWINLLNLMKISANHHAIISTLELNSRILAIDSTVTIAIFTISFSFSLSLSSCALHCEILMWFNIRCLISW